MERGTARPRVVRLPLLVSLTGVLLSAAWAGPAMTTTRSAPEIDYSVLLDEFRTNDRVDDFAQIVLREAAEARAFLRSNETELEARSPTIHFRSPEDTDALVEAHPLLEVDYTRSLVVGTYVGTRPNGTYTMRIDAVRAAKGRVRVRLTETGSASGPAVVVYPAQFIVLSKVDVAGRPVEIALERVCDRSPCAWEPAYRGR